MIAEAANAVSTGPEVPPQKSKTTAAKKPAKTRTHPPTGEMVVAALTALKDKKGCSLQAIKKFIALNYECDVDRQSTFIRKYLKTSVEKETIVQTKGSGASGRFKIAPKAVGEKKAAKKSVIKKPEEKKSTEKKDVDDKKSPTKPAVVKKTTTKTATDAKKPKTVSKSKAVKPAVAKSPSKAKKSGKAPAAIKPKTPKPKKAAASKTTKSTVKKA